MAAVLSYYRNRDEQWWQELPPSEKWNYVHFQIPMTDVVMRAPLPFEFGAIFGALPVAFLENFRNPGTLAEAIEVTGGNMLLSYIPAFLNPLWEVAKNETWNGSDIVPQQILENREPADQFTSRTDWLSKAAGDVFGYSPARIEHLANGYTGSLYGRVMGVGEAIYDPTVFTKDLSSLPIVGTMFLRKGTSRIVGDFTVECRT